jgi:hypothetical protein
LFSRPLLRYIILVEEVQARLNGFFGWIGRLSRGNIDEAKWALNSGAAAAVSEDFNHLSTFGL